MGKKIRKLLRGKAVIIPLLVLSAIVIIAGSITIAGSGTNSNVSIEQDKALSAQKQIVLDFIAKNNRKAADESFKKLTEFEKSDALAEAVYSTGFNFQYKMWDAARANSAHKFIIENFPNSKYSLLSGVELIRSKLRSGKNADSDVEKWMSTYKYRPEFASELPNSIYLIAQAYSNNKKDEKANPLFQFVASTYPKTIYGTLSQMRIDAINKSFDAADVVGDYLISRHRDNPEVEKAIRSLAEYYRTNKEYDRSIHFYTSIIDNYENTDDPVKPYREAIYSYIDMNDVKNARDLIDEMQKTLAGNKALARANFDIANYFLKTGDSSNGLKLHKFNVESYSESLESLWSQAAIVWFHVSAGDEENANIEYAKMLSLYKDEKTLAKEVAQVGDRYLEMDNSEKARSLYQQVLDDWPQSEYVFNAKTGLIKADIKDGNDATVLPAIDALITDFNDRRELPNTVFLLGEEYWNKAIEERYQTYQQLAQQSNGKAPNKNLVNNSKTTSDFIMTIDIWSRIINNLPVSNVTPQAYMYTGDIYEYLCQYKQSIEYHSTVVDKWPEYENAWSAQYKITKAYKEMAIMGEITKNEAETLKIEAYQKLVNLFPDCPMAEKANRELIIYNKNKARNQEEQK
jgi:tetratricopeptide (TPR) repeat protein